MSLWTWLLLGAATWLCLAVAVSAGWTAFSNWADVEGKHRK